MPIVNESGWDLWVANNQDPYGKCCVDVAREAMRLLDLLKAEDSFDPNHIISMADDNIQARGITGFMAACVANMVVQCHSRGEEFRKAWNKKYGAATGQEDSEGILNPAVLHVGKEGD